MKDHPDSVTPTPLLCEPLDTALREGGRAILIAPPGAGKTTQVPLWLLTRPWCPARMMLLEPRRLAARAVAQFMAAQLGERLGQTVGLVTRTEREVGQKTRIEVVTEGILTRRLQRDPALAEYGLIIFDEFHERNLQADLGLALAWQSRELLRPDLRFLVMSATLAAAPLARLLDDAPVVQIEGRRFPVSVQYLNQRFEPSQTIPRTIATIRATLPKLAGSLLVFLPGRREIEHIHAALAEDLPPDVVLHTLYGQLTPAQQDQVLQPTPSGQRKIVLSTDIAETSLTIEGVSVVIDSGLARRPQLDPRTGLTTLTTQRIAQANSEQRCGRAGRLGPGTCLRLWPEPDQSRLAAHPAPEILAADLTGLALTLACWGAQAEELAWLDPPPAPALAQGLAILELLGAVTKDGKVTEQGRQMETLGTEPRLARMLIRAGNPWAGSSSGTSTVASVHATPKALPGTQPDSRTGTRNNEKTQTKAEAIAAAKVNPEIVTEQVSSATWLAALLEERDPLNRNQAGTDVRLRLAALAADTTDSRISRSFRARLRMQAERYLRLVPREGLHRQGLPQQGLPQKVPPTATRKPGSHTLAAPNPDAAGTLLAWAYPDRIAARRDNDPTRYLLSNGRGARLPAGDTLVGTPFLVAAVLDNQDREALIQLAAPITREELLAAMSDQLNLDLQVAWDDQAGAAIAQRELRLGALILKTEPAPEIDSAKLTRILLEIIAKEGLEALPWTPASRSLLQRMQFARHAEGEPWPKVDAATLNLAIPDWLAPWTTGMTRREHLRRLNLEEALRSMLPWPLPQRLDHIAPSHWPVPSGSRIRLDYSDPERPVLAVRIQEMFGCQRHPSLADGRVPLILHLLSPAGRPAQITQDLPGFWQQSYPEVRKDLRGRYPKHDWPEDPLAAPPQRGTKRRHPNNS